MKPLSSTRNNIIFSNLFFMTRRFITLSVLESWDDAVVVVRIVVVHVAIRIHIEHIVRTAGVRRNNLTVFPILSLYIPLSFPQISLSYHLLIY